MRPVFVLGIGMTPFGKSTRGLEALGLEAVQGALLDATMEPRRVEAAYVANAVGGSITGQEMIAGQVILRALGITAIPVVNVENACASASTALHLGWQAVATGIYDTVLCVGVEKMTHHDKTVSMKALGGALDSASRDALVQADDGEGFQKRSPFMDVYAGLAKEYMERSEATVFHFAKVAAKSLANGLLNPYAQYGREISPEDVLQSREIISPLTLFMCSPISDGAAAVILTSRKAAEGVEDRQQTPQVRASVLVSGMGRTAGGPATSAVGRAAAAAYEQAGLGPADLSCLEVHDAVAPAELIAFEELGLAQPGEAAISLDSGRTSIGGSLPVNPSGGLIARGHPIGATGLAQICEATWQLRGQAGTRQVQNMRAVLTENAGGWLDGDVAAACVTILTSD